jgi:hypothetical protein
VRIAYDGGDATAIPQSEPSAGGLPQATWWREAPPLVWVHMPAMPIERAVAVTIRHR